MQCEKTKRNGQRCGARALTGKRYCALHDDQGRAAELGSKGGRRRAVYSLEDVEKFEPPRNAAELRDLLAHSIVETRTGKLDPKLANSLAYLATSFLRALEVADLEKRLAILEAEVTVRDFETENPAAGKEAGLRPAGNLPA